MIDVTALTETTAPTVEPVTLAEAKTFLRIDHDDDDTSITSFIIAARQHGERVSCWRTFVNTTWTLTLDGFPSVIDVPRPPLSSVSSIKYDDTNGDEQTLAASKYRVDTSSEPGRITEAYGQSWPTTRDQTGAVRVQFVAGYGAAASDVPDPIKNGIKCYVRFLYFGDDKDHEAAERLFAQYSMKAMV